MASENVITLSDANFAETIAAEGAPVLVDFWAEWCGPCKQIAPSLDELASEMEGKVAVAKMNIDDNPAMAAKYGIRGIPTLMIFKGGELVSTKTGALAKGDYKKWIDENV